MLLEKQIIKMLMEGLSPGEIMNKLEVSRDNYYTVWNRLIENGQLARLWELPDGATTETCPPLEVTGVLSSTLNEGGLLSSTLQTTKSFCTRYGWLEPPITSDRYNRSRWTGHAVRRVDFEYNKLPFMVCGFLVPRADKKAWQRAVPQYRTVYIEYDEECVATFVGERNRAVAPSLIEENLNMYPSLSTLPADLVDGLCKAVAWVCEGQAILTLALPEDKGV